MTDTIENLRKLAKRYDMTAEYNSVGCYDDVVAAESTDGAWVRFTDIEPLIERLEAAERKTGCTMGVGVSDGQLFVHGDYDSIKVAQAIVLERDDLRAELAKIKAAEPEVWAVSGKTFSMLFASEELAKQFISGYAPSISGGMSITRTPVIGQVAPDAKKGE